MMLLCLIIGLVGLVLPLLSGILFLNSVHGMCDAGIQALPNAGKAQLRRVRTFAQTPLRVNLS